MAALDHFSMSLDQILANPNSWDRAWWLLLWCESDFAEFRPKKKKKSQAKHSMKSRCGLHSTCFDFALTLFELAVGQANHLSPQGRNLKDKVPTSYLHKFFHAKNDKVIYHLKMSNN